METAGTGTMTPDGESAVVTTITPKKRSKGGIVTVGTVIGLVAALGLTLFGLGAADHAVANHDASSWLWSSTKSEMARVNGATGRVDTRMEIPAAHGHTMQVSQTDRFLILRDLNSGKVSALDLATLQVTASAPTTAGLGVSVALHDEAAFIIDSVQGVVRQLDPRTLTPVGEPVHYPPGITGGTFDGAGRLWVAVPGEGTVSAVTAAPLPGSSAAPSGGAGGGLSPALVRTVAVSAPSHDLVISALDDGVAVLDRTTSTLTTVRGDEQRSVELTLPGRGALPPRTAGADVPVTVVDNRHVYIIDGPVVHDFAVPGEGPDLRPAVAFAGRFYATDDATGTVYALDREGNLLDTIEVKAAAGPLELEVREGHLFINAPNSSTARVVDEKHRVRTVDKYANDVLGGDPPPAPRKPPPPRKPVVGPPSAPKRVTVTAGDAAARVSWRKASPNGAEITRYVVGIQGEDRTFTVRADQRSLEVTALTNGETYRFTVHAVNAKGDGPKRLSNPVVPTSEVPDPPERVTAEAMPDGTVQVQWPAANGQGRRVVRYTVTAVSQGTTEPAGETDEVRLTIPDGTLEYGRQYAFTVASVNDRGAASDESVISDTVVPFTVPGEPRNVAAATVTDQRGAVRVQWQPADDHGREIQHYLVDTGDGQPREVAGATGVTITGLGDGQNVTVRVRAVNEAGEGPAASATARTIAPPTVTATRGAAPTHNQISVPFTVNDGGSPVRCTISVNNGAASDFGCRGGAVNGLWPGNTYNYRVTVTNAAGSASFTGSQATPVLQGTVLCDDNSYCGRSAPRGGIWVYPAPRQSGSAAGDVFAPSKYQATCQTTGESVDARPWGGKNSNRWIRIRFQGDNYIPFAWFRLDSGDDFNLLPRC